MYKEAKIAVLNHGVIAFPTETVMGLGVAFDDEIAYKKLNQIKRRPEDKPYTLMLHNKENIQKYAFISDTAQKIIDKFLPGAVTLLLEVKDNIPSWVTHGSTTIGIRVPDYKITYELLKYIGKPLLVPSANRSGEKPAMNSDEVKKIFGDELDYIVDGHADGGLPSTIIDLSGENIKIVRKGPISEEQILKII